MQKSFWWWQCSDRYIISLSPHLHTTHSSGAVWESRWPSWAVRPKLFLKREKKDEKWDKKLNRLSAFWVQLCYILPSTGPENNTAHPKTDKRFSFLSHFSSFLAVWLLFKCRFVAWQMGSPRHSSGAVWRSRWPSWAFRPNERDGFCGRKATLNQINRRRKLARKRKSVTFCILTLRVVMIVWQYVCSRSILFSFFFLQIWASSSGFSHTS